MLLERCSDGLTQNASESLHSVIWDQAPMTKHASLHNMQRAAAQAICRFNQGVMRSNTAIVKKLGYSAGSSMVRRSLEKDRWRLHMSNKDHTNSKEAQASNTLPTVLGYYRFRCGDLC